jgi:hypothetical protein
MKMVQIVLGVTLLVIKVSVIILNSAVKEDENGAGTQKHEGF